MEKKIKEILKQLLGTNQINYQQYRTYLGQIKSGNLEGCILGLKRKKLIKENL